MKIILGIVLTFISSCASGEQASLPPVYVYTPTGHFFVPECQAYGKLPKSLVLVVPTVQEADLFKYIPARDCLNEINSRRALELEQIGKITPTAEMHARRAQFEREQSAQATDAETERKLREIQEKQVVIDEKLNK